MVEYKNPIPVVVGLVFVERNKVLRVRRTIEPFIGEWALPGGYVEEGDDWRIRLKQEIEDEACVIVSTRPQHMKLYDARTTPDGKKLLLFAVVEHSGVIEVKPFKVNEEASERDAQQMDYYSLPHSCFSLHNDILRQYQGEHCSFEAQHLGGW